MVFKFSNASLGISEKDIPEKRVIEIKARSVPTRKRYLINDPNERLVFSPTLRHFRFPKSLWYTTYTYNGIKVIRCPYPDKRKKKIYTDCLIPPLQWWYPSKRTIFMIGSKAEPEDLIKLIPRKLNPSIWYNSRRKCYAIVVPKNLGKLAKDFLNLYYRYSPDKNDWIMRQRRGWRVGKPRLRKGVLYNQLKSIPEYWHDKMEPVASPRPINARGITIRLGKGDESSQRMAEPSWAR